jgi:hypothetical protein
MADTELRIKATDEISIVIDTWDDIFSDFDPRPLSERALSEDFIIELRKRYRETPLGVFTVSISPPAHLKDDKLEKTIIQRIKRYFRHSALARKKVINSIRIRGVIFVIIGTILLAIFTFANHYNLLSRLANELSAIILLPLGWFGIWEGCSKIVDTSRKIIEEAELLNKFSKAEYAIKYIEEIKKEQTLEEKPGAKPAEKTEDKKQS